MAKEQTRYIFSMGELKRKDNSIAFKNEKGTVYLPIEDTKEIYCMNILPQGNQTIFSKV